MAAKLSLDEAAAQHDEEAIIGKLAVIHLPLKAIGEHTQFSNSHSF